MLTPPPVPCWDQGIADRFLAACDMALSVVGSTAEEQRGLDHLAREQWTGASRTLFDELAARRRSALDDLHAELWHARAAVAQASAAAPAAVLAALVQAMPLSPGAP